MLCADCRSLLHRTSGGGALPGPRFALERDRLHAVLCAGCGALLPAADPLELMLGKLAQLARFGLDPEARPLLTPAARHN